MYYIRLMKIVIVSCIITYLPYCYEQNHRMLVSLLSCENAALFSADTFSSFSRRVSKNGYLSQEAGNEFSQTLKEHFILQFIRKKCNSDSPKLEIYGFHWTGRKGK